MANEEQKNKVTSVDMSSDELVKQLNEAQVRYPAWGPEKVGAILSGKIEDIKDYPFMHQGKGSIVAVINTGLDGENERIAFWLNTVAQSQLLRLRNEKLSKGDEPVDVDADHETRAEAIKELIGEGVIIQYGGEEKSKDKSKKNLNPYQKYTIVRK